MKDSAVWFLAPRTHAASCPASNPITLRGPLPAFCAIATTAEDDSHDAKDQQHNRQIINPAFVSHLPPHIRRGEAHHISSNAVIQLLPEFAHFGLGRALVDWPSTTETGVIRFGTTFMLHGEGCEDGLPILYAQLLAVPFDLRGYVNNVPTACGSCTSLRFSSLISASGGCLRAISQPAHYYMLSG